MLVQRRLDVGGEQVELDSLGVGRIEGLETEAQLPRPSGGLEGSNDDRPARSPGDELHRSGQHVDDQRSSQALADVSAVDGEASEQQRRYRVRSTLARLAGAPMLGITTGSALGEGDDPEVIEEGPHADAQGLVVPVAGPGRAVRVQASPMARHLRACVLTKPHLKLAHQCQQLVLQVGRVEAGWATLGSAGAGSRMVS